MKIDRSGLAATSSMPPIVPEKDPAAYRVLSRSSAARSGADLDDRQLAEVGHQPGARGRAHAVFVPHHATWRLEHQEIDGGAGPGTLLVLERFRDLRMHFLD